MREISGSAAVMQGNYVKGEGEALVSGVENAEEFTFNAMKYAYGGKSEFKRYAKRLFKCCAHKERLRKAYGYRVGCLRRKSVHSSGAPDNVA